VVKRTVRTPRRLAVRRSVRSAALTDPVILRLPSGREIRISPDDDPRTLQQEAMYWAYVVRSRRRWAGTARASDSPIRRLVADADLKDIADGQLVEIDIPYVGEATGWEYRVLPWEHLLSEATKQYRGERPLTVIRRLRAGGGAPAAHRDPLTSMLVVESAPGGLGNFYDVKAEGELMLNALGLRADQVSIALNPTESDLRTRVVQVDPTLVHLAGVDTHQAIELLELSDTRCSEDELDGFALAGPGLEPLFTSAEPLAAILAGGASKPELLLCNFYNSAARISPLAVAAGVRSAIGYQDVIEDTLAAAFCTTFYRSLRQGKLLLESFQDGITALRERPTRLKGAGIVLWSAESLLAEKARRRVSAKSARLLPADRVPAAERIRVDVKPLTAINYSLLHNRRSLFKTLDIFRRDVTGPIENIEISATLFVGEVSFPFQQTVTMKASENYLPIAERVVVPLTSSVIRTQGESIQSSLYLKVTCAGAVVYADTSRVQLSPVDEWTDTDENRWWLPSFVLPRDPVVARIIDRSQRYLMSMADDPTAGFDGYQSVDESAATVEARYGPVDLQVRAIWSALLYDFRLHYINPPPSYSASNQRLRTPSDVVRGRRGTCIDLALLLSACLEYVDIYPVVFLLTGHAFPGYWRSDTLHDDYRQVKTVPLPESAQPDALRASQRTTERFEDAYALKNFLEARALIAEGKVVPLETVWLTTHGAFSEAIDEGRRNLRRANEFDSMIDVTLARGAGVTPLPILWRAE
jgi:hypothetical protein